MRKHSPFAIRKQNHTTQVTLPSNYVCQICDKEFASRPYFLSHINHCRSDEPAKGNRNEHRSISILQAAGYRCCRSAASLGAWDIIGIGSTDVVLCQVKTRDWPGAVEMETLQSFRCPPNCRRIIHCWRDRQRLPDVREM